LTPVLRRVEAPGAAVSTRPQPAVNPGAGALEHAASYVDIGRQTGRPAGYEPGKESGVGVLRSLAAQMDPVAGARSVTAARVIDAVRVAGLIIVVVTTVSLARPGPASGGARGPAIAVTLGLSAAAWIAWMLSDRWDWLMTWSLVVMGGAGGVLAGLSPNGPAVVVGCVATFAAGARLSTMASLAVTAETVAGFLVTGLATGIPTAELVGYAWAFIGLWTVALTRNEFLVRAVQAERTLAETRRAREAETQAAAFAERARIARDLHDVLAHSLAAVSVNLQAAEGLLTSGTLPEDNPELVKAIECIDRAGTLTRDGLTAAKRAVLALRDDAAPLPEQLASLAEQYRTVGDPQVNFEVSGEARPIPAEASVAAYRTAQEALTNARKHAPGESVTLRLGYGPDEVTLSVVNPIPSQHADGPLADTGGGFGLVGLRERAVLAGGTFEAGPDAGNWQVNFRIPT
jgi:signal transduction histidine kinase